MSQISDKDRILIEKHLDCALSEAEKKEFNQRLEDPVFAAELRLYEQSVKAIYTLGDNRLKEILMVEEEKLSKNAPPQLVSMNREYKEDKKVKIVSLARRWAMAAAVLVLVGAGLWYFVGQPTSKSPSLDIVFEQNFEPYKNYEAPNVRDNATKNNREKAYSLYGNGEYRASLSYFEKIDTPQYQDQFLRANAYLATQQAEKAAPIFEKLSKTPDFDKQQTAEWYLALSLLQRNTAEAKRILERIKNDPQHQFSKKAAQIVF